MHGHAGDWRLCVLMTERSLTSCAGEMNSLYINTTKSENPEEVKMSEEVKMREVK